MSTHAEDDGSNFPYSGNGETGLYSNGDGEPRELAEAPPDNLKVYTDEELEEALEATERGTRGFSKLMAEKARRANGRVDVPDGVAAFWDFEKPDPLEWTVAGLVPEGHLSMLIGDGGVGKSFLGLHMALCVATGQSFLKRGVKRGRVLYVDQELDEDEQKRRTHRVATGMGLSVRGDDLRRQLYYMQPDHGLGTEEHQEKICNVTSYLSIDLVVYDSFTMGAAADVKDESDVVPIVQQIREWPTTLAIDHVSHSTALSQRAASARAFGSVMKRNGARSSLTLTKADTGGYAIQQEKSNFDAGDARLCYASEHTDEEVTFERIDEADERAAGLLGEMSSKDVTLTAVKDEYEALDGPVLAENVVTWRCERDACKDLAEKTIQNHFTTLKERDELVAADGKGVLPKKAEYGG